MRNQRLPTYYISHGGGPWPYMAGPFRARMATLEQSLSDIRAELGDVPRAVLVISGHWEEPGFAISSGEQPGMVYDYSGFSEELYEIRYRAPGSPALARRVQDLLHDADVHARLDPERGFDHGTFSLMKPLYGEETMPVVQLSLDPAFDPAQHLRVGRALAPLRDEGVLIVGSGASYHNLRQTPTPDVQDAARQFDAWLRRVVSEPAEHRARQLIDWTSAPFARLAHPREDHLIPLMTVVGAAGEDPAAIAYHQDDFFDVLPMTSFRFGEPPVPGARTSRPLTSQIGANS